MQALEIEEDDSGWSDDSQTDGEHLHHFIRASLD